MFLPGHECDGQAVAATAATLCLGDPRQTIGVKIEADARVGSGCVSRSPTTRAPAATTVSANQRLDAATDDCMRCDSRSLRVQCSRVAFCNRAGAVGVNFRLGVLVLDRKPPVRTSAGPVPIGGRDHRSLPHEPRFPRRHSPSSSICATCRSQFDFFEASGRLRAVARAVYASGCSLDSGQLNMPF